MCQTTAKQGSGDFDLSGIPAFLRFSVDAGLRSKPSTNAMQQVRDAWMGRVKHGSKNGSMTA
jgi:hypothetical protein